MRVNYEFCLKPTTFVTLMKSTGVSRNYFYSQLKKNFVKKFIYIFNIMTQHLINLLRLHIFLKANK